MESERTKILKEALELKRALERKRTLSDSDMEKMIKLSEKVDNLKAETPTVPAGKIRLAAVRMQPFSSYVQDFSSAEAADRAARALTAEGYEVQLSGDPNRQKS
jgi:hypothetical protein